LEGTEKLGELKTVRNADWNLEIGAITEISGAEPNPPRFSSKISRIIRRDFAFNEHVSNPVAHRVGSRLTGFFKLRRPRARGQRHFKIRSASASLAPQRTDQENFFAGKDANVLRFPQAAAKTAAGISARPMR
jgi:hypothetical protein